MTYADHLHRIDHSPEMADDLAAIAACLDEWGIQLVDDWDERSLFNPTLPALGQCDALVTSSKLDGVLVLDLKTGSIKPLDCAMQLACYASATHEARLVDGTVQLEPLLFDVRTDVGLILHAPWGKGKASIVAVDLIEGRRLAELAIAAHQETLDSGRVVIKDVGSRVVPSTHVEPTSGAGGDAEKEADPEQSARAKTVTPPAPSLHARIGGLRQRLKHITTNGPKTVNDIKALMTENDLPPLAKPDNQTVETVDTWESLVMFMELELDPQHRVDILVERLKALPDDLYQQAQQEAKQLTPPIPHLKSKAITHWHCERLEEIIQPLETQAQNGTN